MHTSENKTVRCHTKEQWLILLAVAFPFLVGTILGCIMAISASEQSDLLLRRYLEAYLLFVENGDVDEPNFLNILWSYFRFPVIAFGLGFTAAGVAGVPLLFAIRGFLLSFSISSFIKLFGMIGAKLSFLLLGISELAALPVLFVLGTQGFSMSVRLLERIMIGKRGAPIFERSFFLRCCCCAVVLIFFAVMHSFIMPFLLTII